MILAEGDGVTVIKHDGPGYEYIVTASETDPNHVITVTFTEKPRQDGVNS